ncbi:MAG: RnfH family protein [Burkholderiales bacterium]|nr:RnfH family protein [Burkholderiales bacterium]
MRVELVYADAPHALMQQALSLPAGATVGEALRASGWVETLGEALLQTLQPALWGRVCGLDTVLRERDRVELTRPLKVDPKEARRQRYRRDGIKRAPRA